MYAIRHLVLLLSLTNRVLVQLWLICHCANEIGLSLVFVVDSQADRPGRYYRKCVLTTIHNRTQQKTQQYTTKHNVFKKILSAVASRPVTARRILGYLEHVAKVSPRH